MVKGIVATAVAVIAVVAAHGASAAVKQIDGSGYADLVAVSPGVYGVEAISGQAGNWQLGVGPQTSNVGTFNSSKKVDWKKGPFDFKIEWKDDKVVAKIGGTEVKYGGDWKIGDAIRISTKGEAVVTIKEIEGTDFDLKAGAGQSLYFADLKGFGDGWSLTGTISMRALQGSRDFVQVTMGNVTETPIPAAVLLFGTGVLGLGAFSRRARNS